ncbi:hypothetical protein M5K25_018245 [Dendrobium thyrsiflorum]|uniref:Uncharacterized protein n=1 Tax=Dendrobium thyrsiflorum TaxID=117978 RepID=A0ABD0UQ05_DENTH
MQNKLILPVLKPLVDKSSGDARKLPAAPFTRMSSLAKWLMRHYANALQPEGVDGGVKDATAATHYGNGSAVLPELRGDLEADPGPSSRHERHLPLKNIGLERRLHFSDISFVWSLIRHQKIIGHESRCKIKLETSKIKIGIIRTPISANL